MQKKLKPQERETKGGRGKNLFLSGGNNLVHSTETASIPPRAKEGEEEITRAHQPPF